MRDLSRLPSRAGDEARREAREWVEGFADFLSLAVLAIVCADVRVCEVEKIQRERAGGRVCGLGDWRNVQDGIM